MEPKCKCACCGCFSIENIFDICPICYWQQDSFQEEHVNDNFGPNLISLQEAQDNYKKYGAIELQFNQFVRPPLKEETDGDSYYSSPV